jgi:hypothetical protein
MRRRLTRCSRAGLRLAFRLRTTTTAGLSTALCGKIINLSRVHVENDLTTPGVGVLDRHSRCFLLVNLFSSQITDKYRLPSHESLLQSTFQIRGTMSWPVAQSRVEAVQRGRRRANADLPDVGGRFGVLTLGQGHFQVLGTEHGSRLMDAKGVLSNPPPLLEGLLEHSSQSLNELL